METYKTKGDLKIKYSTVIYFILFLFAIDFMNNSGYIFLLIPMILFIKNGIYFNRKVAKPLFYLILFSFTYTVIYFLNVNLSLKSIVYFFIGPIFSFLIGKDLINSIDINTNEKNLSRLILTLSFGMFIHGFLNMIVTIKEYGISNNMRIVMDFWRGQLISATGQGMFFTMIVCTIFAFLYESKKNIYIKISLIFAVIISILSTVELASRTLLVIFAVVGISSYILYLFLSRYDLKKKVKMTFRMFLLVSIIMSLYNLNLFGIKDYLINSPLIFRLDSGTNFMETSRTDIIKDFFKQWQNYPFGGYEITMLNEFKWTHNLWLDIYSATGIIPFILFIMYTLYMIKDWIVILSSYKVSRFLKILLFSSYIGMILNFSVEPILESNPYFFMVFIMLNGAVNSLVSNINRKGNRL